MARIDAFLRLMIEQKASDLHFNAGNEPVLRVHRELLPVHYRNITTNVCLTLVSEILPDHLREAFDRDMDVDFAYQLEDQGRFRVNLFRHLSGVGATFHLIPLDIPSMEDLNLPDQVRQFTEPGNGLVLITGPGGNGKSTTIASILEAINETRSHHILTIEDPIEFVFKRKKSLISQREIGLHTPDFSTALTFVKRGSADVVYISDFRDTKTIQLALTAAQTGALVFAAMSASSCDKALARTIDMFPPDQQEHIRSMLSVTLRGVVTQMLVPRSGARGHVPVVEVLSRSPDLTYVIREDKLFQIRTVLEKGDTDRNLAHDTYLKQLLDQGIISLETATASARNPNRFQTAVA